MFYIVAQAYRFGRSCFQTSLNSEYLFISSLLTQQTYNIHGGPKSKPLPNDQQIVLNRHIRFIRQIKV